MTREERLVSTLAKKGFTIATAESLTGGLLSAAIVNVPGASTVFGEGYVTYANEAKTRLAGVSEETIKAKGAVSEETAAQMASGCAKNAGADLGLSTTGIAGPDGGTKEKPVGLVYIGCFFRGEVKVSRHIFSGDRNSVRLKTVEAALDMALDAVGSENDVK